MSYGFYFLCLRKIIFPYNNAKINIHSCIFLYNQFCYSVCFESVNLFQDNCYSKKKYEHNTNIQFASVQAHQLETLGKCREQHTA